jgi:hypothetical protein
MTSWWASVDECSEGRDCNNAALIAFLLLQCNMTWPAYAGACISAL